MDYHYKGDDTRDFGHGYSIDAQSVMIAQRAWELMLACNAGGEYHEEQDRTYGKAQAALIDALTFGLVRASGLRGTTVGIQNMRSVAEVIYSEGLADNHETVDYNLTQVFGVKVISFSTDNGGVR